MFLAQSAVRDVGFVIFAIVIIGFVVYLFFNLLDSRGEGGAEVELAANRKPYHDDDILETRKLDQSLLSGLALLSIIGIALPLYWLGEPGRQEGLVENTLELWAEDGAEEFEEACSSCHGGGGAGGDVSFAITEPGSGEFIASVDWIAPSLTSVLTRFSEDEVLHTLNFGRNGVMPAWGAPGGGPLTTQQLEILIVYLRTTQRDFDSVQASVQSGLVEGARAEFVSRDPDLSARLQEAQVNVQRATQTGVASAIEEAQGELGTIQAEIGQRWSNDELEAWIAEISDPEDEEYLTYGRLLFTNRADSGAYGCARCHTNGWSFNGSTDIDIDGNVLNTITNEDGDEVPGHVQGGGAFGPNLTNGGTLGQFTVVDQMESFIGQGSTLGERYGSTGQGSGQMPGFGARIDGDLVEEIFDPTTQEFIEVSVEWPASLTEDQIAAIVAYERSL